ncbi:NADH-quinone oxidoreductase subunit NuoE [Candidatus Aciduliprofundum boonei]|uniref:NADH dehydrogenase (Ubiquinone) 24 kDa subunit n=1 Tax=Aciduliprofundum boonei (strain DSM 19572 / T469) TaxID=439481 RepID=B5IAM5_ACIB4|nr:NADH-quinone oxidoreductase subunit NuoE [Candidatus Aciduliprofundum boonei]ADD08615.1 NADH dehydrogenase (ubiquinone) 24 kDa subunit [Aciduliprofundum boonei T469]EDY36861.1 Respiratory-chain NADH dehydrogenase 24 Kd subunit superfamily [Aciduliprofundum boonei T469]HII54830.1 NADH-quinone oxidoreductase subunit NuoE [Candidatus Aciduliprofundum boonei]
MEEKVLQIINKHKNKDSKLLAILHDVQDEFGYIPEEAIKTIAKELGMKKGEVYDAASFYSFFRFKPEGKHEVMICDCIVCHIKGSERIIERIEKEFGVKMGETTKDGKFTFKIVEGLGHCEHSPVMMIDGKIYGDLTPDKVVEILRGCQ